MNTIKVTFLLLKEDKTREWTVMIKAATTDLTFTQLLQQISVILVMQGSTVLRVEVVDKGMQDWWSFEDIISA